MRIVPKSGATSSLWKQRARLLEVEVYALYLACKDPKVPWYAKVLAACVVGYAFSPIDLIPDFIPVIGHLDDLVLIPLGVLAVRRMIPAPVMAECRERARIAVEQRKPVNRTAAVVIVMVWVVAAVGLAWLALRLVRIRD